MSHETLAVRPALAGDWAAALAAFDADRPADDREDLVLAVELEASRGDPYRRLSRLFHLLGRRGSPNSDHAH